MILIDFLLLIFSQEKSEKATDPVVDCAETVQTEASVVLASHPGTRVL